MKFTIILISLLVIVSSCSLWENDEKDRKIQELETKMNKLLLEQESQIKEIELDKEKYEEEKRENEFNKNMSCISVWNDLKKTFSNIISWYYNPEENKCYVRYTDKSGKTLSWPSDEMTPVIEPPKPTEVSAWGVVWKLEERVDLWYYQAEQYCSWLYPKNTWRIPTKNNIDKARQVNKSLFTWEKFYWSSTPYEWAENYDTSFWIFWPHWTWWGKTWNWAWCSIWNTKCLWNDMRATAVRCIKDI